MSRNYNLSKAEELDKDVSAAFHMGFWTGGGLASFGWIVLILGTLYYLGAYH